MVNAHVEECSGTYQTVSRSMFKYKDLMLDIPHLPSILWAERLLLLCRSGIIRTVEQGF